MADVGKLLVRRLRSQSPRPQLVVTSRSSPNATLDYLEIGAAASSAAEVVALQANPTEEGGQADLEKWPLGTSFFGRLYTRICMKIIELRMFALLL